MATHLTRGELKRNELGEAVEASVHWVEKHLKAILYGAAGLLGVALLVWGVIAWRGARIGAANQILGEALRIARAPIVASGATPEDAARPSFADEASRAARARTLFESLVRDHGATDAGAAARLWLADQAIENGDRAAAAAHWSAYLATGPDGLFAATAQRNLWVVGRADGRGEEVLSEIRGALEGGDSSLPADALLWELAVTQRHLDNSEEERGALLRIVDEHPNSPFASPARERLAEGAAVS
jgi:TolA-binding protein